MNFYIIILLACAAIPTTMSRTLLSESSIDEIHSQWMIKHGRTYANTSEMVKRRAIFKKKLEFIEKMNEMNKAAGKNYTLGLNDFSDLAAGEFTTSCAKSKKISNEVVSSKTVFLNMSVDDIPESIDWREKGAVTPVKRQGNCGACWAFATMAALEGLWQIKTGELISLSAQHLIDCDRESEGCEGGYLDSAFEFETTNNSRGVPKEEDYPYKEIQQACRNDVKRWAAFDGYQFVPSGDEQQLLLAVAQQPVTALVAVGDEFEAFKGEGIYSGTCGSELNHAIAIVGYGVSNNGQKYWIIKNSWGQLEWGDSGYMKLIRGTGTPGGHCGISSSLSFYPTLKMKFTTPHNI